MLVNDASVIKTDCDRPTGGSGLEGGPDIDGGPGIASVLDIDDVPDKDGGVLEKLKEGEGEYTSSFLAFACLLADGESGTSSSVFNLFATFAENMAGLTLTFPLPSHEKRPRPASCLLPPVSFIKNRPPLLAK